MRCISDTRSWFASTAQLVAFVEGWSFTHAMATQAARMALSAQRQHCPRSKLTTRLLSISSEGTTDATIDSC